MTTFRQSFTAARFHVSRHLFSRLNCDPFLMQAHFGIPLHRRAVVMLMLRRSLSAAARLSAYRSIHRVCRSAASGHPLTCRPRPASNQQPGCCGKVPDAWRPQFHPELFRSAAWHPQWAAHASAHAVKSNLPGRHSSALVLAAAPNATGIRPSLRRSTIKTRQSWTHQTSCGVKPQTATFKA